MTQQFYFWLLKRKEKKPPLIRKAALAGVAQWIEDRCE